MNRLFSIIHLSQAKMPTLCPVFCLVFFLCLSCAQVPNPGRILSGDFQPPVYHGLEVTGEHTVTVEFNEPVSVHGTGIRSTPALTPVSTDLQDSRIKICFAETLLPGKRYVLKGAFEDKHGNSNTCIIPFYGYNPYVPGVLINEFTTQGSGNHPDCTELRITAPGNLAGLCLYDGTLNEWNQRIILPFMQVYEGDYLIIHWKPEGLPTEVDETLGKTLSGGLDASPYAYDFWVEDGSGLSGNNGAISLYRHPRGGLLDAVLYSNRTKESDETYGGFGSSSVQAMAVELFDEGGWLPNTLSEQPSGCTIYPEDAINPTDSTATRTMCRRPNTADTNTKTDWYITVTSGSTFGTDNTSKEY